VRSAIFKGEVLHHRVAPVSHGFQYSDTMFYLDLEELESANDGVLRLVKKRLRRSDHFGDVGLTLLESVRSLVRDRLGIEVVGRVGVLTHIRQLGYVMNPVSFYYCWNADESALDVIIGEVHNTPWGESHCYLFACSDGDPNTFRFPKEFHVSPFMGMDQEYVWTLSTPGEMIRVYMENWQGGVRRFDASLTVRRKELTRESFRWHLWSAPFSTLAVICRIYWQALRLLMKRTPTFTHPAKLARREGMK
jgi:hypothetical protein